MGLTEEQVAELRRHYARYGASDTVFIGHPKTVERGKAVLALLAERDTLRARVGELEADREPLILENALMANQISILRFELKKAGIVLPPGMDDLAHDPTDTPQKSDGGD